MRPALELLRQLQEAAFRDQRLRPEDVQLPPPPGRMRSALAAAGWSDEQLLGSAAPHEHRETPLQAPQDFAIVQTAVRSAIVALETKPNSSAAAAACNQIVFGTIPTGDLIYSLVAVRDGERPLLLFPSSLLRFAYLLSKCVALCFDYEERREDGALRYAMNDPTDRTPASIPPAKPESGRRFHELYVAYTLCGTADMAPTYAAGPAATNAASTLTDHMLCYVAAHALYSALNAGQHTGKWVVRDLAGVRYSEWVLTPAGERQADQAAIDIMARAARTRGGPEAFLRWAPLIFLHGSELAALALERLLLAPDGPRGVPALAGNLRDRAAEIVSIFPEHGRFQAEVLWMRELLDALWRNESASIERARSLGFAPGVVRRPDDVHGRLPMAYEEDGRLVPFIDVKGATRRREMEQFLRAAGQTRFEREWPQRPKDVVICYRAALFSAAAERMSAALRERGFAASHDHLILVPGEHWEAPLQKAIGSTHLVVFLLDVGNMASRVTSPSEAPLAKEIKWALDNHRPVLAVNVFPYEGEGAAMAVGMLDAMFALIARKSETSFASIQVKTTGAYATGIPEEYVVSQIVSFLPNPTAG